MSTAEPILIVQTGAAPAEVRARFGDFPDWFTHALGGNGTRTVRVDTGGRLPPPDEVNAAVITGSAAMVSEHLPWSEATAGWLREAADSGAALLGVCYGHQLLAHAFGGGVDYHPDGREIGTIEVDTLPSARDDALFGKVIGRHPAQATHEQSVLELPRGAVRLASSAHDPNQAVRYRPRVWGVQFHPEFSADVMRAYIRLREAHLRDEGLDPDALEAGVAPSPELGRLLLAFRALAEQPERNARGAST